MWLEVYLSWCMWLDVRPGVWVGIPSWCTWLEIRPGGWKCLPSRLPCGGCVFLASPGATHVAVWELCQCMCPIPNTANIPQSAHYGLATWPSPAYTLPRSLLVLDTIVVFCGFLLTSKLQCSSDNSASYSFNDRHNGGAVSEVCPLSLSVLHKNGGHQSLVPMWK